MAEKHDQNKPPMHLLPPHAIEQVAKVFGFGAKKYAAFNYLEEGGLDSNRLIGAAMRHINAWNKGETLDPESGENHLAHAVCSLTMLLEILHYYPKQDKRFKVGQEDYKWHLDKPTVRLVKDQDFKYISSEMKGKHAHLSIDSPYVYNGLITNGVKIVSNPVADTINNCYRVMVRFMENRKPFRVGDKLY